MKEKDTQAHREYTRENSQDQKLQKSSKSKIEKGWFLHTENQSSKVLKKRSLRSGIARSESSKHLLFLSFHIHHIKQEGTLLEFIEYIYI